MSLDATIVQKAVGALLKFQENQAARKKADLLDDGDVISLQLALRKVPDRGQANPKRVNIPHPVRDLDTCRMCLFVKEDSKKAIKEALEAAPVPGLAKVITLNKLRTHFARFGERRQLCKDYDLFFCDDRILPMMPQVLGKEFFSRKKLPISVKVTRPGFGAVISKAAASTFLHLNWGSCCSVRIGMTTMESAEIAENVMAGIENIVGYIPQKWKNVQSVHLKTTDSLALPLFQAVDFELDDEQIAAAAAAEKEAAEKEEDDAGASAPKKKGTKRKAAAAAAAEEEEEAAAAAAAEEKPAPVAPKSKAKTPKKAAKASTDAAAKSTGKRRRKASQ